MKEKKIIPIHWKSFLNDPSTLTFKVNLDNEINPNLDDLQDRIGILFKSLVIFSKKFTPLSNLRENKHFCLTSIGQIKLEMSSAGELFYLANIINPFLKIIYVELIQTSLSIQFQMNFILSPLALSYHDLNSKSQNLAQRGFHFQKIKNDQNDLFIVLEKKWIFNLSDFEQMSSSQVNKINVRENLL